MSRQSPGGLLLVVAVWALVLPVLVLSVCGRVEAVHLLPRSAPVRSSATEASAPVRSSATEASSPQLASRIGGSRGTSALPAPWTLSGPPRVGVQAGHWRIEELPEELSRLRGSTGARSATYREVDANLDIARRVVDQLRRAGIAGELLPATVPPGYLADAFVSIHADGAARSGVRGWKAATAWRASDASRELLDAVTYTYGRFTGLPEDRYGTTYGMRGYYAFSPHRTRYAVDPATPAVIIEAGFVTVAADREVLFGQPENAALGISTGILRYLARRDRFDPGALAVRTYPAARVRAAEAALSYHPRDGEKVAARLPEGTLVRPVHREEGWVEVIVWGNYRRFGWLRESDLELRAGPS